MALCSKRPLLYTASISTSRRAASMTRALASQRLSLSVQQRNSLLLLPLMLALLSTVHGWSNPTRNLRTTATRIFSTAVGIQQVILKRSQQSKSFRNGNQLVFTKTIKQVDKKLPAGALVEVLVENDSKGDKTQQHPLVSLGFGVYNPDSLYRVRFLCHKTLHPRLYEKIKSTTTDESAMPVILDHHLSVAKQLREALQLNITAPIITDTFRMVNGEGDHLSGLAIDMVNRIAVVMSSAAWCQIYKEEIMKSVQTVLQPDRIVWRTADSRLTQDGYKLGNKESASIGNDSIVDSPVVSTENSVQYLTFPFEQGQKTGVYCDQRENRINIAKLCKDKRVLDLCCYHGGFSLNAAIHGPAASCTGVDSSADAIAAAKGNAKLNNCHDVCNFVQSDVTKYLQELYNNNDSDDNNNNDRFFDVVILDPPKLAPSVSALDKARRKYHSLNRDAIKLVDREKGGLLFTCTCSAAMTQEGQMFLTTIQGAALAASRQVTLLRVSGASACHTQSPVSLPAGNYLTGALFYVHPV